MIILLSNKRYPIINGNMKKKTLIIIGIIAVLIILISIIIVKYPSDPSWGEKGELSLTISTDRSAMDINGSIRLTGIDPPIY